jgi:hypothetical protein
LSSYEITRLRPDLLTQVAELARQVRGGTLEQQLAYYEWKYFRNPYLAEPLVYVALLEGRAVGIRGFYGSAWQVSASRERHVLPTASDSAVHENHRRTDVYHRLNEAAFEEAAQREYAYLVNFSASPENALVSRLTYGWKSVLSQRALATGPTEPEADTDRPRRRPIPAPVRTFVRRGRNRVNRALGRQRGVFTRLDRAVRGDEAAALGVRATRSPEELAEIAARAGWDERLQPVRDAAYYRWRLGNPAKSYRVLLVEEGEECGYLIVSFAANRPRAQILDWRGTTCELRDRLIGCALDWSGLPSVAIWSTSLPDDDVALLAARGFGPLIPARPVERWRRSLLVRALHEGEGPWHLGGVDLRAPASWSVSAIASDTY